MQQETGHIQVGGWKKCTVKVLLWICIISSRPLMGGFLTLGFKAASDNEMTIRYDDNKQAPQGSDA